MPPIALYATLPVQQANVIQLFNHSMKKFLYGFTLLELLVVIGIIGILVGLGAVSYSTAQKKARDAKRKSDLQTLQNCLEQYYSYNNNFKYPVSTNDSDIQTTDTFNCGTSTISIQDPLDNTTYYYTLTNTDATNQSTYTICATALEAGGITPCLSNQQ